MARPLLYTIGQVANIEPAILADRAPNAQPIAARRGRRRGGRRSMLPREHGAYASLLFPILTVVVVGHPTEVAWLLITAAALLFLAHEPMLAILGRRGSRIARDRRGKARALLALYGAAGLVLGGGGLWMASRDVQFTAVAPLSFAAMAFLFSARGLAKTGVGQALVACAFSLVALPVGLACGLTFAVSICVAGAWALVGLIGSAAVQLTVDRNKRAGDANAIQYRYRSISTLAACMAVVAAAMASPFVNELPLWILAAAWPSALVSAVIVVVRPSTARIRRIGWALVGANTCTFVGMVGVIRLLGGLDAFANAVFAPYF